MRAELHDIEDGCQLLIIPPSPSGEQVKWLGLRSNVLFVRPVYREFYERLDLLGKFDQGNVATSKNTLLRGVPGIGKSSFGQ